MVVDVDVSMSMVSWLWGKSRLTLDFPIEYDVTVSRQTEDTNPSTTSPES